MCTDPATLAGRPGAPLRTYLPTGRTPAFSSLPGLYTSRCVTENDVTWLQVDSDPADPRFKAQATPDPSWGLHRCDVQLPLVEIVRRQTA